MKKVICIVSALFMINGTVSLKAEAEKDPKGYCTFLLDENGNPKDPDKYEKCIEEHYSIYYPNGKGWGDD